MNPRKRKRNSIAFSGGPESVVPLRRTRSSGLGKHGICEGGVVEMADELEAGSRGVGEDVEAVDEVWAMCSTAHGAATSCCLLLSREYELVRRVE
jgi:hypothetical protein